MSVKTNIELELAGATAAFGEMTPVGNLCQRAARFIAEQREGADAREREAAARALSDAADALNRPAEGAGYEVWASGVGDWLRARAAEIREGKSDAG